MSIPDPSRRADAYRTLILVEVMSNGPFEFDGNYDLLHTAITEGDCSGRTLSTTCVPVTDAEAALLLEAQGSDAEFLLGPADEEEPAAHDAALIAAADEYPSEAVVQIANGSQIRTPEHPEDCSYVRVIGPDGLQVGYWAEDEWKDAPAEVMGAIFGAAMGGPSSVKGCVSRHAR